jgi:uncharacterized protein YbcV (DUF1398 family)
MNIETMRAALEGSLAGKLTFPEVVGMLTGVGVESYFVDLVRAEDRFYMPHGETHMESVALPLAQIAKNFSQPEVVSAIRAVQADAIRYPEFLTRLMAAGIVAYWVFVTGRRVIYFGRKGECHVEEFPPPKG